MRGLYWVALAVFFFSTSPIFTRWAAGSLSAYEITTGRMLSAGLLVLGVALARRETLPPPRDWPRFVGYGLVAALHFGCYIASLNYTTIAHSLAITYTAPIFVALFSSWFLGEGMDRRKWFGTLVALAGVGAITRNEPFMLIAQVALVIGILNLALGLVNLLPAFPLDGGRVARAIGWRRSGDPANGLHLAARIGRWLGIGLAAIGVVMILTLDSIDGLMIALSGWFLVSSSRAVERTAAVDAMLAGLRVGDVMDREVKRVPAGLTLDTFAAQVLDAPGGSLPVVSGTDLVGVLGERQVRRVRRDRWPATRAADLMTAAAGLPAIDPEMTVRAALDHLHRTGLDGLPVLEAGALAGVVTRRAVAEAIRSRLAAGPAAPAAPAAP